MPALDLVILLARNTGIASTLQRDPTIVDLDTHLIARDAGQLRRHDERFGGFTEIDGRCPALRGC